MLLNAGTPDNIKTMPYHLDYSDQVRFGMADYDEDPNWNSCDEWALEEAFGHDESWSQCPECGAWGQVATDPHNKGCSKARLIFNDDDRFIDDLPF